MPPLPQPRAGRTLCIKDRPLEFSFWPVEKTTRRFGLGTRVFATDPWTVIRRSTERRCLAATGTAAFALLEQAEDFYHAAQSGVKAAKPLLLYYCFMNLAKAYILVTRRRDDVNGAQHGLAEKLSAPPRNQELRNAYLEAYATTSPPAPKANVFDELLIAISHSGLKADRFDLPLLMPQVVPGHRLWAAGAGPTTKERFVSLEKVEFIQATHQKEIWLRLYLFADDLRRINLSHQEMLERTGLQDVIQEVGCTEEVKKRRLICLEQLQGVRYSHRPSDRVPELVATIRHKLWRTVLSSPPYRKYYLYPAPLPEASQVLPQILSIYAITFYLAARGESQFFVCLELDVTSASQKPV